MFDVSRLLNFSTGEVSSSEANLSFSSSKCLQTKYDWLIFSDSRGLERDCSIEKTWVFQLCAKLKLQNLSYLVVSRPKNITIFPTLINFLVLNKIKFDKLITNLGFVDCTPKKLCFVNDMKEQIQQFYPVELPVSKFTESISSDGVTIDLYSLQYSNEYLNTLASYIMSGFVEAYLITTTTIDESIVFPRKRPRVFYEQIRKTNEMIYFIGTLSKSFVVDLNGLNIDTFDAVHYIESDHVKVIDKLSDMLIV